MTESQNTARLLALLAANGYGLDKIVSRSFETHDRSLIYGFDLLLSLIGLSATYIALRRTGSEQKPWEIISTAAIAGQMGMAFGAITPPSELGQHISYAIAAMIGALYVGHMIVKFFASRGQSKAGL